MTNRQAWQARTQTGRQKERQSDEYKQTNSQTDKYRQSDRQIDRRIGTLGRPTNKQVVKTYLLAYSSSRECISKVDVLLLFSGYA